MAGRRTTRVRAAAAAALALVLLLPALLAGCGSDGSDASGPRPDLPVGSARQRFADAGSFALALGADVGDGAVAAALGQHDLVVVDGEGTTAAQVAQVQDGGTVVLAYLSVGTLEPGRPWFTEAEDGGWLLDHWDDWDEWYAAVDQPGLRDLLLGVAADELAKGFDGLFLDNVDMVEAHPDQAEGMEQLVADLDRLLGPDRLLVSQNGDASVDRFADHLDGWNREDVSATYDFDAERYVAVPSADTEAAVATLERLARQGLLVTATDYTAEPTDPLVAEATGTACAAGAVPFSSTIALDRIPTEPARCG